MSAQENEVVEALQASRAIAILRKCPNSRLQDVAKVLAQTGFRLVEITLDSLSPFESIRQVIANNPTLFVGAGTVHTSQDVQKVAEIGGSFVVSPIVSEEVLQSGASVGLATFPGAATPTEVAHARSLGATAVKVFPIEQLGGPGYLKAILSPLLKPRLIPTGGVNIDNASKYLEEGAFAVGVGSAILRPSLIESGDYLGLENLLKEFMGSIT